MRGESVMKLKVPVNSYAATVKQIDAGADEIYMGLEDALFHTMSFSARAQVTYNGSRSTLTEEEFAKSVQYAHARNVAVNFTANCQHITKSPNDFYRRAFLDYVRRGIALGTDALIVADIGNLIAIRKAGIEVPVIAGSYLNCFNSEMADFLKQFGVFWICIPDHVTLDEVREIKAHTDIEVEVFIGYGCSNLGGMCRLYHNSGEKVRTGVPCRARFLLKDRDTECIMDTCPDCAVCSIPALCDARIDSLKLTGREMNFEEVVKLTKMYKDAILTCVDGREFNKKAIVSAIPWWESDMCGDTHCKRCRYEDTSLLRSYI